MYGQCVLTLASRLDVMNRLGRAMADPTRSRILLQLLEAPGYPARLSESLGLTRTNVSNHLACLRGCGIVAAVPEGSCMVESAGTVVDGSIDKRWQRAIAALGLQSPWQDDAQEGSDER